jgi:hypothetical protein
MSDKCTTRLYSQWQKETCQSCESEFQITRAKPKEVRLPIICHDCKQSDIDYKNGFDIGYEKGKQDALAAGEQIQMKSDGTVETVFPQSKQVGVCAITEGGLTLRQYYAGLALQGVMVNAGRNGFSFNDTPKEAVRQADALIKELEKDDEPA